MSRSTKRGNGILFSSNILDNDIVHFIFFQLGSEVDVDFNTISKVLFFDSVKKRVEPFRRTDITNDPGEVNLRINV